MKKAARTTTAERTGRWLGRAWRGLARQEVRAVQWLAGKGLPAGVTRLLLGIVKLSILVLLLYSAFWLALLLLLGVAVTWVARNSGSDWERENNAEWREGHSGFGLYDKNEWRRDMGDPDDP
ncbi:MAG: DUF3742 family protein [Gammaproteobacteria bacterium]